jgi:hypothetical protein
MVHHRGYVHLSIHTHHTCHDASLSCCIQPYKIRMVRPSILDSRLRRPPHTQSKKRKNSTCTAASQHEPNQCGDSISRSNETHVRQMVRPSILDSHRRPSPRIHLLFVRWFGRPFWTHADVHPQIPGIHSKENSTCTAASQREPNQWVDSIRLPE